MDKESFLTFYQQIFEENNLAEFSDAKTAEMMHQMVSRLLSVNEFMNLTAITDPKEIIVKHLADSCTVLKYIPQGAKVCDIGCGGGFPSLPIAIARPDITVIGIDSTGKKVDYLNETARLLSLANFSAICGRAENLAQTELRESFDIVTARAVAALPTLCELCIPFVKVGGSFCALKGNPPDDEIKNAAPAYQKLGAPFDPQSTDRFVLNGEARVILVAKKTFKTPTKYPRPFSQIKKKHL